MICEPGINAALVGAICGLAILCGVLIALIAVAGFAVRRLLTGR